MGTLPSASTAAWAARRSSPACRRSASNNQALHSICIAPSGAHTPQESTPMRHPIPPGPLRWTNTHRGASGPACPTTDSRSSVVEPRLRRSTSVRGVCVVPSGASGACARDPPRPAFAMLDEHLGARPPKPSQRKMASSGEAAGLDVARLLPEALAREREAELALQNVLSRRVRPRPSPCPPPASPAAPPGPSAAGARVGPPSPRGVERPGGGQGGRAGSPAPSPPATSVTPHPPGRVR